MTRPEYSNTRSLAFSAWIRRELPNSRTGFMVTNQDWVFWNFKTRRLLLAEEKTNHGAIAPWFYQLIRDVFHPALSAYCHEHGIAYHGYHLIQFERTSPEDGRIFFDRQEVDVDTFRAILSLEHAPSYYLQPYETTVTP